MKSKNLSENILRAVRSKGFKYIDLPSVIEANHIVQRSGENFRKFIFSFVDQNGSELCLRPDLTIASCLRYLENNLKGKEKIFYSGQAYRKSQNKKDSIIRDQVGFEIIGSKDEKNDDKEIITTSLKSLQNIKYTSGTLTIGNVEIFNLLISKLDIPKRWKLRLSRHFWREKYFNDLLKRSSGRGLLEWPGKRAKSGSMGWKIRIFISSFWTTPRRRQCAMLAGKKLFAPTKCHGKCHARDCSSIC